MTIHFATDHAGYELKNILLPFVRDELGYTVIDHGALTFDENDDYPTFVQSAVNVVSQNPEEERAIILGKSGEGEAMVANRFPHIRATVYYGGPTDIIVLSREHNNANVLSLGAGFLNSEQAKEAVTLWLKTSFLNEERHARRNEMIDHTP